MSPDKNTTLLSNDRVEVAILFHLLREGWSTLGHFDVQDSLLPSNSDLLLYLKKAEKHLGNIIHSKKVNPIDVYCLLRTLETLLHILVPPEEGSVYVASGEWYDRSDTSIHLVIEAKDKQGDVLSLLKDNLKNSLYPAFVNIDDDVRATHIDNKVAAAARFNKLVTEIFGM